MTSIALRQAPVRDVPTGRIVPTTPHPRPLGQRVTAVDVLRGFAMVVMTLDHTREFFTNSSVNPLDPQHTTFLLFLTRWMTHVCAPIFVFLAGTSIFFQQQRKSTFQMTYLLVTRGLWLIVAELTLVHLVFSFHWQWSVQLLEVIWAIGGSMMIMAALIRLGLRSNLLIGVLLVTGHNAFDGVNPASFGPLSWLWKLLHVPGLATATGLTPPVVIVAYPLLPWIGVMALGYAFGALMHKSRNERIRFETRAGTAMLAAFVLLRWTNFYGDPFKWNSQANWWRTLLCFLNVQKYPPSLLFLLVTLGSAALIMAIIEICETREWLSRTHGLLAVYGRVPFFYFLLHITVIHLFVLLTAAISGGNWKWWVSDIPSGGVLIGHPPGYGYDVGVIWCIWAGVVAVCYPACKWYARIKQRGRSSLLSYL